MNAETPASRRSGPWPSLFVVSALAWASGRPAVEAVITGSRQQAETGVLLIDTVAMQRLDWTALAVVPPLPTVPLISWLLHTGDHYLANQVAITADLGSADPAQVLVIDASAFDWPAVFDILHHMRHILFAMPAWPGGLAFVLREELLTEAVSFIGKTFFFTPSRKTLQEASVYANDMRRAARLTWILNLEHGAAKRLYAIMTLRFRDVFRGMFRGAPRSQEEK
jgi:hypothetical protein